MSRPAVGAARSAPWRGWVAAFGVAMCSAATAQGPAEPAPIRGRGYHLVKDWHFGVNIVDAAALRREFHTRYLYDQGRLDYLNDEWQRYRDNANHRFENGMLSLVATVPGELKSGAIESGMLRSKWAFQYGYIEARMKVPTGRGFWPAFWLNPQDGRWPPEIDVVEIVDNGRDTTRSSFHFLHGKDVDSALALQSRLDENHAYRPGFDYAEGFHTYAVEWTPGEVAHYVDGALVVRRTYAWRHDDGSDGGPAHVLVNLAVGGKWPGPPLGREQFPARLVINFIRIWQR